MDTLFEGEALQAILELDLDSLNVQHLELLQQQSQQQLQQQHQLLQLQHQQQQQQSLQNGHQGGVQINGHNNIKDPTLSSNNSSSGNSGAPHHLPESPPDSGSEPPFSPPDLSKTGSPNGLTQIIIREINNSDKEVSSTTNNQPSSSSSSLSSNLSPSSSTSSSSAAANMHPIVPPTGHHNHNSIPHHMSHHMSHHMTHHHMSQMAANSNSHPHLDNVMPYGPPMPPSYRGLQSHPSHHLLHGHHALSVPGSAMQTTGTTLASIHGAPGGPAYAHLAAPPAPQQHESYTNLYSNRELENEAAASAMAAAVAASSTNNSSSSSSANQKKRKYNNNNSNSQNSANSQNVSNNNNGANLSPSESNSISPKSVLGGNSNNTNIIQIKQERRTNGATPEPPSVTTLRASCEEDFGFDYNSQQGDGPGSVYMDSSMYQCIKFQEFLEQNWHPLYDASGKELPRIHFRVDADKGFNFSPADDSYVCQKKNHFQVTVHVQATGIARYVKSLSDGSMKEINKFFLHFYGCKTESPTQTIKVEQSQSDRSKKSFHPQEIDLIPGQVSKTTVGRLHFSETTSNNMRKKGKPNPDQRYFHLVVTLAAHCTDNNIYHIVSHASERIIVRASNPGQFENDLEMSWQKGSTPETIFHAGKVGINTDRPDEALVVHGSVKVTGHIISPSDQRAKDNICELDTREQLKNVSNMRIVKYNFKQDFAKDVGLTGTDINGTGVLAQEVAVILPDAVKQAGNMNLSNGEIIENFLVVNNDRIFMENVGAVKELCKVTDNLETRIDELERMNNKLRKINRFDSIKSVNSSITASINTNASTCHSYSSNNVKNSHVSRCASHRHQHSSKVGCPRCHHNHHSSSKSSSSSYSSEICSNKFMQSIIMILVLVMAFCVASMATLYILDHHKRPNSHTTVLAPHNSPGGTSGGYFVVPITNSASHHNSNSHHNSAPGGIGVQTMTPNLITHTFSTHPIGGTDNLPSPDNAIYSVTSHHDKVPINNRDKNLSQSPKTSVTSAATASTSTLSRTRPPTTLSPLAGHFSTSRILSPSSSSSGMNPFNDLSDNGKASDRQNEKSLSSGSSSSHNQDQDSDSDNNHPNSQSGTFIHDSKSVSNPVSNGVAINSDTEVNV